MGSQTKGHGRVFPAQGLITPAVAIGGDHRGYRDCMSVRGFGDSGAQSLGRGQVPPGTGEATA